MKKFLWEGVIKGSKSHLVNWEMIKSSKMKGIRH